MKTTPSILIDLIVLDTYFLVNARTHKIDQTLQEMAADGLQQVVVLGAGFDTRAYRFAEKMPTVKFFELDHPPTSSRKQEKVKEAFSILQDCPCPCTCTVNRI